MELLKQLSCVVNATPPWILMINLVYPKSQFSSQVPIPFLIPVPCPDFQPPTHVPNPCSQPMFLVSTPLSSFLAFMSHPILIPISMIYNFSSNSYSLLEKPTLNLKAFSHGFYI